MNCTREACNNTFDVPAATVTLIYEEHGAMWGFYCSNSCASADSNAIFNQIDKGGDVLDTDWNNIDPMQGIWNHIEENTPTDIITTNDAINLGLLTDTPPVDVAPTPEFINQELAFKPDPEIGADTLFTYEVANTLVQLFQANIGGFNVVDIVETLQGDDVAGIALTNNGAEFKIIINTDNHIQFIFAPKGSTHEAAKYNVSLDPATPNMDLEEIKPVLLKRVADGWSAILADPLLANPLQQITTIPGLV